MNELKSILSIVNNKVPTLYSIDHVLTTNMAWK